MSKVAFIFPGQGVQKVGMGKDFYDQYKTAAKVFDQATELLGIDMKKLCFEENDRLDQTEYTQAALVTVCMAMERVAEEEGLVADVTESGRILCNRNGRGNEVAGCNPDHKKKRTSDAECDPGWTRCNGGSVRPFRRNRRKDGGINGRCECCQL
mgnify:CR=1 FL=1